MVLEAHGSIPRQCDVTTGVTGKGREKWVMGESASIMGAPPIHTAVYPVQSLFPHLGSLNLQKKR